MMGEVNGTVREGKSFPSPLSFLCGWCGKKIGLDKPLMKKTGIERKGGSIQEWIRCCIFFRLSLHHPMPIDVASALACLAKNNGTRFPGRKRQVHELQGFENKVWTSPAAERTNEKNGPIRGLFWSLFPQEKGLPFGWRNSFCGKSVVELYNTKEATNKIGSLQKLPCMHLSLPGLTGPRRHLQLPMGLESECPRSGPIAARRNLKCDLTWKDDEEGSHRE